MVSSAIKHVVLLFCVLALSCAVSADSQGNVRKLVLSESNVQRSSVLASTRAVAAFALSTKQYEPAQALLQATSANTANVEGDVQCVGNVTDPNDDFTCTSPATCCGSADTDNRYCCNGGSTCCEVNGTAWCSPDDKCLDSAYCTPFDHVCAEWNNEGCCKGDNAMCCGDSFARGYCTTTGTCVDVDDHFCNGGVPGSKHYCEVTDTCCADGYACCGTSGDSWCEEGTTCSATNPTTPQCNIGYHSCDAESCCPNGYACCGPVGLEGYCNLGTTCPDGEENGSTSSPTLETTLGSSSASSVQAQLAAVVVAGVVLIAQ